MGKSKNVRAGAPVAANTRPGGRLNLLTLMIGAALAQLAAPAWADSGTEGDPALGNALNKGGVTSAVAADPDGMGGENARTPTGFLEANPPQQREWVKGPNGWRYRGLLEIGALGTFGDRNAFKFREYKDLSGGIYLNNFLVEGESTEGPGYVQALGGGLGRGDQFFGVTAGQYNGFRVRGFYSETTHTFTSTYRNLWSGTGTDRLTLNNGLPAAGATSAAATDIAIGNAALATPYSSLGIVREKGGIRLDMPLSEAWKVYASAASEHRRGSRPFGLVGGGGGGTGGVEIPESINYDTHDLAAGVQWASGRTAVNVQASASLFRNNVNTMTVDNPMFLPAANGIAAFPRAVFDLYPDNDAYSLKGEFSHAFDAPWKPRVTGTYVSTRMRQDDALIPWVPYAGANLNGVAGGSWDTTASLSRKTAQQRLDTSLADLKLALAPTNDLDVALKWRQYQTDNSTPEFLVCNPLTGQWGRLINDGSGSAALTNTQYNAAGCSIAAARALNVAPSAGNINIMPVRYEYKQTNVGAAADWRVGKGQTVNASLERETFDRANRERSETWEDKAKLGYVNRSVAGGTLRFSVEQDRRRGSTYVADPYDEFYSASLGPLPTANGTNVTSWIHINDLHRKFDLADRDQTILNLRYNLPLRDDLDLSLSGQYKEMKYPTSQFGRNGRQSVNTLNAELNWQPSTRTSVYGYLSAQEASMNQRGVQQNACVLGNTYYFLSDGSVATTSTLTAAQQAAGVTVVGNSGVVTAANFMSLCGTASATSPLYPLSRGWTASQRDRSPSLGLGVKHDFGKALVDVNYTFTESRTKIGYTYNPTALGLLTSGSPTAAQVAAVGLMGAGMPDIVFRQHILDASVLVPVNKSVALRFIARYEYGRFNDWHYDGVAANPTPSNNQQTYLDSGPQSYHATALGAVLQVKW